MRVENGYIVCGNKYIKTLALYYNSVGVIEFEDVEYMRTFNRLFIKRANSRGLCGLLTDIRFRVFSHLDIHTQFILLKFILDNDCDGDFIDCLYNANENFLNTLIM